MKELTTTNSLLFLLVSSTHLSKLLEYSGIFNTTLPRPSKVGEPFRPPIFRDEPSGRLAYKGEEEDHQDARRALKSYRLWERARRNGALVEGRVEETKVKERTLQLTIRHAADLVLIGVTLMIYSSQ